jgi:hypothetical protein
LRADVHTEFWWGKLGKKSHMKDHDVEERIILKYIFTNWNAGLERIDRDMEEWRVL